jgi:hypothetical protein
MNYYGIKGPLIKWFENYFYQRKQKVINRATSSTVCEVSAGVPQGTVLGTLHFNFRRIPKCLDTFKIIFSMWLFHLASLDKVLSKKAKGD